MSAAAATTTPAATPAAATPAAPAAPAAAATGGGGADAEPASPASPATPSASEVAAANELADGVEKLSVADGAAPAATAPGGGADGGAAPAAAGDEKAKAAAAADAKTGLHDTETKLMVQRDDPNSPLYSAHTFEELNLHADLLKGIYAMGFNKPSRIQEHALPLVLTERSNLVAQAQSGTGKTAAFALSMLSSADPAVAAPQALCVCPTRELARQNVDVITRMAQFTKFAKPYLIVPEVKAPRAPIKAQIIVGTPGKINGFIRDGRLKCNKLRMLVLDEADEMIDAQGQLDQTKKIKAKAPDGCQFLLFSATYNDEVGAFAETFVPRPLATIRLEREKLSIDRIEQFFIDCDTAANKFAVLDELYGYMSTGQSIIFVQTRRTAADLQKRLTDAGHAVSLLSGELTPAQRDKVMDAYRSGETKVLLSTNVLSRGIDIDNVTLVINYDLPFHHDSGKADTETYLHRIGRTGRFGRAGIAINFVHDAASKQLLDAIKAYFMVDIKQFAVDDIPELASMLRELQ